jgi:hypothetical protein
LEPLWRAGFDEGGPPGATRAFLRPPGLKPAEVANIRRWSKVRRKAVGAQFSLLN